MGDVRAYIQARPKLRYWASVRWPIADLVNRSSRHCWADLVTWALGWRKDDAWPDSSPFVGGGERCRRVSETHPDCACYCGKFVNGQRHRETP